MCVSRGLTCVISWQCFCSSNDRHLDPDLFPSQEARIPAIIQESIQEVPKLDGPRKAAPKPDIDSRATNE